MASLQHNFRAEKGRATRLLTPQVDETLIYTAEQAREILRHTEQRLSGKVSKQHRAELLLARASIYEALGDPFMLQAAEEAAKFAKTAQAAALVAVALHHHGRLKEAIVFYRLAKQRPHQDGFEIDLSYVNSLLFDGKYAEAWPHLLKLKKRMVYAAYLKTWMREPIPVPVSIISEGGFGDIIHTSRYIPLMNAPATIYLPPYFFQYGFVDLMRRQPWLPPVKQLIETPPNVPAIGFFDFPAVFQTTLETIPVAPVWEADPERVIAFKKKYENLPRPLVGFCHEARAMETPLCPKGVYRALTEEQTENITAAISSVGTCINLQHGENPDIVSWEDNAAIIACLDYVVTVDTANMHLAASMNKPTWVVLSGASDWKFGISGNTTPWYPSIRLFRNDSFGFDHAVNSVREAITSELK